MKEKDIKMKTGDLLTAQLKMLADTTRELYQYARAHAPDGWDFHELETVDAMVNTVMSQSRTVLTSIGEPLKTERAARKDG